MMPTQTGESGLRKACAKLASLLKTGVACDSPLLENGVHDDLADALLMCVCVRTAVRVEQRVRRRDVFVLEAEEQADARDVERLRDSAEHAVLKRLQLRGVREAVERRSVHEHVSPVKIGVEPLHVILLNAGAFVGEAVVAPKTARNLRAPGIDAANLAASRLRTFDKHLGERVGIAAHARTSCHY